jgi:hypothetical protein
MVQPKHHVLPRAEKNKIDEAFDANLVHGLMDPLMGKFFKTGESLFMDKK